MADDDFFTPRAAEPFLRKLSEITGMGSGERIYGKCVSCTRQFDPKTEFRDPLSAKDYTITGFCQQCQDRVYAEPEEDE